MADTLARRFQAAGEFALGNCAKKAEGPPQSGPSREKSSWANARMALETLPQFGVYETWFAESSPKTVETLGE
ncbi:MAG: hypothetical protein WBE86_00175 [Candidatus Acidiferrales bacterium]